jgi:hypothetical protein
MKLSPHAVRTEQLGAGQSERIIFDDDIPGFGLRLRERGSRTFVFQYKLGAKQRRITLGTASALAISKVRKTAGALCPRKTRSGPCNRQGRSATAGIRDIQAMQ